MRCLTCLLLLALAGGSAGAEVPQLLSYQGKLTDAEGTPAPDGTYSMEFRFYDACVDGNLLLADSHDTVETRNGIYGAMLGGGTLTPGIEADLLSVFRNHDLVCLGVTVEFGEEMTPRQQILSSGFALRAAAADFASPESALVADGDDVQWTGTHQFDGTVVLADGRSLEWPHLSGDPPPQAGFRITKFNALPEGQESHPNGEADEQWMVCYNCLEGGTHREDSSQHGWNQKIEATYWDGVTESLEYNWNYTSPVGKKWRPFALRLFVDGTCSGSGSFCVDDSECDAGEICDNANRVSFSWNTRPDNARADFELAWSTGRVQFRKGLDGLVDYSGTAASQSLAGFRLVSTVDTSDVASGPSVFGAVLENDFGSEAEEAVVSDLVGLRSSNVFSGSAPGRDVTGRIVALDAWNSIEQTGGGSPTVNEVIGLRYYFWPTGSNVTVGESNALRVESPATLAATDPVVVERHFGLRLMDQNGMGTIEGDAIVIDAQDGNPDPDRGNLNLKGGGWADGHLRMGEGHLWMDAGGEPRFKSGSPTDASDGSPLHSPPGTGTNWGGVYWGDASSQDHNTGSKVCALAGLDCKETYDLGSSTPDGCAVGAHSTGVFLALCY